MYRVVHLFLASFESVLLVRLDRRSTELDPPPTRGWRTSPEAARALEREGVGWIVPERPEPPRF